MPTETSSGPDAANCDVKKPAAPVEPLPGNKRARTKAEELRLFDLQNAGSEDKNGMKDGCNVSGCGSTAGMKGCGPCGDVASRPKHARFQEPDVELCLKKCEGGGLPSTKGDFDIAPPSAKRSSKGKDNDVDELQDEYNASEEEDEEEEGEEDGEQYEAPSEDEDEDEHEGEDDDDEDDGDEDVSEPPTKRKK